MAKTYPFKIHDESVNTYGFRMLTSGADLEEYRKNPVVLYNHDDWQAPIGRAEQVYVRDGAIYADILFDESDPRAAEIAGKVERGFLRMASVGAWPPEESTDDPSAMLPGQTGPTVTRWTLREVSVCPIGANHNALAMYDRPSGRRIDLADHLTDIFNQQKTTNMSKLTQLLGLADQTGEQAVTDRVRDLIGLRDKLQEQVSELKVQNDELRRRLADQERREQEERRTQAVALLDAAIKDGRLDASGRDAWMADFERDHDGTSARLSSITPRVPVAARIEPARRRAGALELRDLSMAEILKADRLKELKADRELYRAKFREAYGHEPN